jgi:hypothetical protein
MPHSAIKLIPGINQNETPALNEAGISSSNLIRFIPDAPTGGLIQKLGGWTKFYIGQLASIVRALWAWEDTNANQLLSAGSEQALSAFYGPPPNQTRATITPQQSIVNIPLNVSTTAGSTLATITDNNSYIFNYDSVNIVTPISVGGVILFGCYPVYLNEGASQYQIQITNNLGNVIAATSTTSASTSYFVPATSSITTLTGTVTLNFAGPVTFPVGSQIVVTGIQPNEYNGTYTVTASTSTSVSYVNPTTGPQTQSGLIVGLAGPTLPVFNTVNGSSSVTVVLPNNGYYQGYSFSVLVPVTVGGITLFGNFIVQSIIDANTFTINALNAASSTDVAVMNSGNAEYQYFIGTGQPPQFAGYGTSGYGIGGYGTGVQLASGRTFATTAASGDGTTATLSFSGNYYIPVGSTFTLTGMTPSGYNTPSGTLSVVTASNPGASTSTISYANTTTGAQTVAGTITMVSWNDYPVIGTYATTATSGSGKTATITVNGTYYFPVGYYVTVSGVTPTTYNGTFRITASTQSGGNTTVSYTSASTGNQISAGTITVFNKELDWSLDNWGDILLASPQGGPVYSWYYLSGQQIAQVIPQAPLANEMIFVAMPQRQIIALGSTFTGIQDPLLVRWCDVSNFSIWIAQSTNQAGSYRIPRGSKIVGGLQGPQQGLIWTDLAVWSMQYIGQPYIYSFNEIASGCGMISRKAAAVMNGITYWMGQSQFFNLSSNGVQPIVCPVWDVIFQDLDTNNLNKIRVAANSQFGEIAWYYPTINGNGEVTNYVKYNVVLQTWDFGTLSRTAWINQSIFGPPIGAGFPNFGVSGPQYIYQHETSTDADGQAMPSSFQTGYFALNDADQKVFVDEFWPDMKWGYYGGTQGANVQISFYGTDFPGQPPVQYGPYTVTQGTQYFNTRIRNRLLSIGFASNDTGSFWRIGNNRYRGQPDGRY